MDTFVSELGILGELMAARLDLRNLSPEMAMIIAVAAVRKRGEVWLTVAKYQNDCPRRGWVVVQDIKVWNREPTCEPHRRVQPAATTNPGAVICQGASNRHIELFSYFQGFNVDEREGLDGKFTIYHVRWLSRSD